MDVFGMADDGFRMILGFVCKGNLEQNRHDRGITAA